MPRNRRKFIKLGLNCAMILSAGSQSACNLVQAFDTKQEGLPIKNDIILRFAIASDGHYGEPDTNYDQMHAEMVQWINNDHKERGLDFTFINGDLYHDDLTFSPLVKQVWNKLEMPYNVSHGNHDHGTEENWEKTWGSHWNYSFVQNKCAFIVLNTADEQGNYFCPDINLATQLLSNYQFHPHLFVFMHVPPVNWSGHGIDCPELLSLFSRQANLRGIFHGHHHDQDNVKEKEGKHYFFDSHVAGSWGTGYRGYRVVEVLRNGDMLTYQMNPVLNKMINSRLLG